MIENSMRYERTVCWSPIGHATIVAFSFRRRKTRLPLSPLQEQLPLHFQVAHPNRKIDAMRYSLDIVRPA